MAPTDHDLDTILRQGIPDTAMPSFRLLSEAERLALIDYVKYLAIRGEVERKLIEEMEEFGGLGVALVIELGDPHSEQFGNTLVIDDDQRPR